MLASYHAKMCHLKTGKESQSDYMATVKESLDILVRVGGGRRSIQGHSHFCILNTISLSLHKDCTLVTIPLGGAREAIFSLNAKPS